MSTVNSFDKNLHFAELNSPLFTGNPVPTTPAARKASAQLNLGVTAAIAAQAATQFTSQPLFRVTATAVNASATTTFAAIYGGLITSTSAAGVILTLPLATSIETGLIALFPALANGDSFQFAVRNTGPSSVTVTTNTGLTLSGDLVVETATTATYTVTRTSATTYTVDRV